MRVDHARHQDATLSVDDLRGLRKRVIRASGRDTPAGDCNPSLEFAVVVHNSCVANNKVDFHSASP